MDIPAYISTWDGVLFSLPAKDKAAESTSSSVPGKVATPSKVWLNHPRLLLWQCHSKLGCAIIPRLGSHRAGMVARLDTEWAESRSCPCWVPAKDTIAGTQPVPWGNCHTKPAAATATRTH